MRKCLLWCDSMKRKTLKCHYWVNWKWKVQNESFNRRQRERSHLPFSNFLEMKFTPLHKQFNSTSNGLRIIFFNANDFWPSWQHSEEELLHNTNTSASTRDRIFEQRFESFINNCSWQKNIFRLIVSHCLINQFDGIFVLNGMPCRNDLPLCQRLYSMYT